MGIPLQFGPLKIGRRGHSATAIQPLMLASEKGGDLAPLVQAITRDFGFDVFAHGVILSLGSKLKAKFICLAPIRLRGFKSTISAPMLRSIHESTRS
jgi:hypothetical protein